MALLPNDDALVKLMDGCDWEAATEHVRGLSTIFSLVWNAPPQASLSTAPSWSLASERRIVQWVLERAYRGPSNSRKDQCSQTPKKTWNGTLRPLFPPLSFLQALVLHIPPQGADNAKEEGNAGGGGGGGAPEQDRKIGFSSTTTTTAAAAASSSSAAPQPTHKLTPVHILCEEQHYCTPFASNVYPTLQFLLQAFPEYATTYNVRAGLPLHVATRHSRLECRLLRLLLQAYPQGATIPLQVTAASVALRHRGTSASAGLEAGNLPLHLLCHATPHADNNNNNNANENRPRRGLPAARHPPAETMAMPMILSQQEENGDDNDGMDGLSAADANDDEAAGDANQQQRRRAAAKLRQQLAMHERTIQELIQSYPQACAIQNAAGNTPLHVLLSKLHHLSANSSATETAAAATATTLRIVQLLIQTHPPLLTMPGEYGRLPLHLECFFNRRPSILQLLLDHGEEASTKQACVYDEFGNLPLHLLLTPPFSGPPMEVDAGWQLQRATQRLMDAYPAALHLGTQLSEHAVLVPSAASATTSSSTSTTTTTTTATTRSRDEEEEEQRQAEQQLDRRRVVAARRAAAAEAELPLYWMGAASARVLQNCSHCSKTPLHKAIYGAWRVGQEMRARARAQRRRLAPVADWFPPHHHHHEEEVDLFMHAVVQQMLAAVPNDDDDDGDDNNDGVAAVASLMTPPEPEANYHLLLRKPQVQVVLCAHPEAMYQLYFRADSGAAVPVLQNPFAPPQPDLNTTKKKKKRKRRRKKRRKRKQPSPCWVKDNAMVDFAASSHVTAFLRLAYPEYSSNHRNSNNARFPSSSSVAAASSSGDGGRPLVDDSLFAPPPPPPLPPLHAACQYASFPEMTYFLRAHAELNPIGIALPEPHLGNLPLHVACAAQPPCCLPVLDWLLARNAPALHCLNKLGLLPVHVAFLSRRGGNGARGFVVAPQNKPEADDEKDKNNNDEDDEEEEEDDEDDEDWNDDNNNDRLSVLFRLLRETPYVLQHYSEAGGGGATITTGT